MLNFDEYNINNRILLHTKFSKNKINWFNWIYDLMEVSENTKILELGSGNGEMWVKNQNRLPENIKIVISDISDDFINESKVRINNEENHFYFEKIDIMNIPYRNYFDSILANTMLYHSPNVNLAVSEVSKALKESGKFYATTSGRTHLKELMELVYDFDNSCKFTISGENKNFSKENGKDILSEHFKNIEIIDFDNSLVITDFDFFIDFILSFEKDDNFYIEPISKNIPEFKKYLVLKYKDVINVTKSNCMFIASS